MPLKAGRKPASESRAEEIRQRLVAWQQTPEQGRISLRALAREISTTHQLLCFYLHRLGMWQAKEYRRKAEEIEARATAENRFVTPWEETQIRRYGDAAFHSMIGSVLNDTFRKLRASAKAGRISKGEVRMVTLLARRGHPGAREILEKYGDHMNDAPAKDWSGKWLRVGQKIEKNNLPGIQSRAAKSFRRR